MNWKRGTFRVWIVLASIWASYAVWLNYEPSRFHWRSYAISNRCVDRFAKLPNGTSFNWFDIYSFDPTVPDAQLSSIDRAKKQAIQAAWVKVEGCSSAEEAAKPMVQHVEFLLGQNLPPLIHPLLFILGPPVGLLLAGVVIGWALKGFSTKHAA